MLKRFSASSLVSVLCTCLVLTGVTMLVTSCGGSPEEETPQEQPAAPPQEGEQEEDGIPALW